MYQQQCIAKGNFPLTVFEKDNKGILLFIFILNHLGFLKTAINVITRSESLINNAPYVQQLILPTAHDTSRREIHLPGVSGDQQNPLTVCKCRMIKLS